MKYQDFKFSEDGFVGHMAIPDYKTDRAMIVIMGGEKSIFPGIKIAERFADYGISGLSVSLFGAEGIPASPNQIPLEMFGKALDYLRHQGYIHISIYGMSMGTIFAVLTSIYFEGIENVVLVSPTHVPFEGTDDKRKCMSGHSVVTWKGEDIPFVATDFTRYKPAKYLKQSSAPYKVMGMWQSFYDAYQDKDAEENAILPIEKSGAKILLIAGEQDEAWPSAYSVQKIQDYLVCKEYAKEVKTIQYPHVGHLTGMMPSREREKWLYRLLPVVGMMYKTLGKHKSENLEALKKAEKEIIEFISGK